MYKRILVASDGSECAARAVGQAARLAQLCGSQLLVLTVVPQNLFAGTALSMPVVTDEVLREVRDAYRKILEEAVALAAGEGVAAQGKLAEGSVAATICQTAEEEGCDLIVVGSRGHGQAYNLLIGSVSSRVSQLAKVPVLINR